MDFQKQEKVRTCDKIKLGIYFSTAPIGPAACWERRRRPASGLVIPMCQSIIRTWTEEILFKWWLRTMTMTLTNWWVTLFFLHSLFTPTRNCCQSHTSGRTHNREGSPSIPSADQAVYGSKCGETVERLPDLVATVGSGYCARTDRNNSIVFPLSTQREGFHPWRLSSKVIQGEGKCWWGLSSP